MGERGKESKSKEQKRLSRQRARENILSLSPTPRGKGKGRKRGQKKALRTLSTLLLFPRDEKQREIMRCCVFGHSRFRVHTVRKAHVADVKDIGVFYVIKTKE